MVNFLVWNIQTNTQTDKKDHNETKRKKKNLQEARKNLQEAIVCLAKTYDLHCLALLECTLNINDLCNALQKNTGKSYHLIGHNQEALISFISTYPKEQFETTNEKLGRRISGYKLKLYSSEPPIWLVIAHLESKAFWSEVDQLHDSIDLAQLIQTIDTNNENLLVMGDFNMNPYELGMISGYGFHGVASKNIALNMNRTITSSVKSEKYLYFYNPMWRFLGDKNWPQVINNEYPLNNKNISPPGTYYFNKPTTKPIWSRWHVYDQVLLRPNLIEKFDDSRLQILTNYSNNDGTIKSLLIPSHQAKQIAGGIKVYQKGELIPNALDYSDHLPVKFVFNIDSQ